MDMSIQHKQFLVILYITFFSLNSAADSENNVRGEITAYGLYAYTTDGGKTWNNPISNDPISSPYPEPVHVKTKNRFPAKTQLFFGFEYEISQLPDGMITLDTHVKHPTLTKDNGTTSDGYTENNQYLSIDGKINGLTGYIIENKSEAMPGLWHFEISYQGKNLITKEFILTK